MVAEDAMIKFRIDVDYAYPSRLKSFLYTALNIKTGKDYLKNAKIIARMINESPIEAKAYWFFTPKTIPDKKLLELLDEEKHEVALHIANKPFEEMKLLEKATGRKLRFYTIHGTARLLARVIWKRWKAKTPEIPEKFPLESFHMFPTLGLDRLCNTNNSVEAVRIAKKYASTGKVLHIHPVWLFQRGTLNFRGPFYKAFRRIMKVDEEMETIVVEKKLFFKVAKDRQEYIKDLVPTSNFIEKLANMGADILTFVERQWCCPSANTSKNWVKNEDNIALLRITSYDKWWANVGKKTRNMVRKAEKNEIRTELVEPNKRLAEGIWKIYNETPIRQERAFPHFGISLQSVKELVSSSGKSMFVGSFFQEELAGFIQLLHNEEGVMVSQILSLQKHWDKAVNNALIAKAVEICARRNIRWMMYGRMGNHPSLDKFKQSNGFSKFPVTRYNIPITWKGRIALKLGLHKEIKDAVPSKLKHQLIPLYNWLSRNRMRFEKSVNSKN